MCVLRLVFAGDALGSASGAEDYNCYDNELKVWRVTDSLVIHAPGQSAQSIALVEEGSVRLSPDVNASQDFSSTNGIHKEKAQYQGSWATRYGSAQA